MTFYAVELENVCPAYGWQGGPNGDTLVVALKGRQEYRVSRAEDDQHSFILPFQNIVHQEYALYLKSFFAAMYARTHSFLVKDWLDFELDGDSQGTAPSGTTPIQLQRVYNVYAGTGGPLVATRTRDITKPVAGTVTVYQSGIAKPGTYSTTTGLFTPSTSWSLGAALTATGEFRVPVRFNNDYMPFSIDNKSGAGHIVNGSVELIEVFNE